MSSNRWNAGRRARVGTLMVVFFSLATGVVFAADDPAGLSLAQAVQRAVTQTPLLEARQAQVTAAREDAARAGSLPDPMLTVGIDNLPITGTDAFDTGADFMTMKKIGLRQEVPARAKRLARTAVATRAAEEAGAQSQADQAAVRQATATAWLDVWATQREQASLTALRDQAVLAAQLAKARVAGGGPSASEALAAQATVIELETQLPDVEARLAAAQAALQRWTGEAAAHVDGTPDLTRLPVPATTLLVSLDRLAPLLTVDAQVETAAAQVDVARAERRPDWSLAASYGQREGGRDDMLMVEVGIGLPLFPRNRQDRGIAARQADYDAALAMREDLRRQQAADLQAAVARWEGLKRQVALHEDALLPLAHDRSSTALAAYRAGGALQPWLDARRDELEAHLSHARHLRELGRAWAALAYLLPETTR